MISAIIKPMSVHLNVHVVASLLNLKNHKNCLTKEISKLRFQRILRFTLGSRILAIKINVWNQELHTHYGVTNETYDGMFIPFWDFIEDIPLERVVESLNEARRYFGNISDIYIFQTVPKLSFRAVAFEMFEWKQYLSLLAYTDLIDMSYFKHSVMRGRAVLRLSEKDGTKNTLVKHLLGESDLLKSIDHWQLFSTMYPEMDKPIVQLKKLRLKLSKYESFR